MSGNHECDACTRASAGLVQQIGSRTAAAGRRRLVTGTTVNRISPKDLPSDNAA